ncbi:Phosphopantetheinyl transferase [Ignavibacterium album JCM 16511]|uniref:Phosphopantetheinyl transferase n=1 Tax=Ignavibacterium album (strain DSM 19864 / JCM 16511 / NBRC 101810 / Mat9-16) TaxID=945713 RepID=I0AMI3_IGNAJ|nr:4'-phosphopantetheinyl transferase superfamily protein [Ignavibacterium album]AFH50190.1 Phosphopantetheinyl transferase [Ignavibacterium album JCM 16511]
MNIANSEIHIYSINITEPEYDFQKLKEVFSQDEKERVSDYKFIKDRERAIVTFYFRRRILSEYTGKRPEELSFKKNNSGKPLIDIPEYDHLKFNYSHSGEMIIYAISKDSEIGVDIELVKEIPDMNALVENYFSKEEIQVFKNMDNRNDQTNLFYKIWTRKEALVKASGKGISDDLSQINIITDKPDFNNPQKFFYREKHWILSGLSVPENYIATVAYESAKPKEIIYFNEFSII